MKVAEQIKVLMGADGDWYWGDYTYPGQVGTDRSTGFTITLPIAAELRIIPNFGLRLAVSLAGIDFSERIVEDSTVKVTTQSLSTGFGKYDLNIGVYFFF